MHAAAAQVIARCLELAQCTEEPGRITRTYLSEPMRRVHELVGEWMGEAGLEVSIDAVGNIRGVRGTPALIIGSHLDTVPNAGAYDGILGTLMGVAIARATTMPLAVVGFSEEEGVKFGVPFIGSRGLTGTARELLDERVQQSIKDYGLDLGMLDDAVMQGEAYFEIHIEQGPVLDSKELPIGVVDAIAGQSRYSVTFHGTANHAGTTPMDLRQDALVKAAQWICAVERYARATPGLVATVGRCEVEPGAGNVIPSRVKASLDVRHKCDSVRQAAIAHLLNHVEADQLMDVPATPMHLVDRLAHAVASEGYEPYRLSSGAGHDAMIMARAMPAAMLFVRSPNGISHHPDEAVRLDDVAAALQCAIRFVETWNA